MSFSVSDLSNILKLASSSPAEAKALIKLLTIDVIKSLGESKYLIQTASKELTANSENKLQEGARYWTQIEVKQNSIPILSKLIKHPAVLKHLQNLPLLFEAKELHSILTHEKPLENIKNRLLEHLSHASSKEEFSQLSNLLLSVLQNTLTIPLQYQHYFGLFQMKKRYNKTTKRSQIDFYAALHNLGPVDGTIILIEDEISIDLNVAFKTTKLFLEENLNNIRYKTNIHLKEDIQPLYNLQTNAILDINV
ncbi:hypothetical protein [Sulfurimonas sp. HSL-1716]|uniref:hypothetical protein n=1 Tax=Hydrocurvibacter sulfurireducens TaxID=3131937 RepID=UPI0031F829F9